MNIYETPIDWIPDTTYINSDQGIVYLAWQIGRDGRRQKGLWLIDSITDYPDPDLVDLLPVGYTVQELTDDVLRYGHIRSTLVGLSIGQLQDAFTDELSLVAQAVEDGYR